jgi:hypothetical protein
MRYSNSSVARFPHYTIVSVAADYELEGPPRGRDC